MAIHSLTELNGPSMMAGDRSFPSPIAWEDQVFYFLMLDRFSNGQENGYGDNDGRLVRDGTTPRYQPDDAGNAIKTKADTAQWREGDRKAAFTTLEVTGLSAALGMVDLPCFDGNNDLHAVGDVLTCRCRKSINQPGFVILE